MTNIPAPVAAFDEGHYHWVNRLAETHKIGDYGKSHYLMVRDLIALIQKANLPNMQDMTDVIGIVAKKYPQSIFLYDRIQGRHYQPWTVATAIDRDTFLYQEVPMPIFFNYDHVAYRHEKRAEVAMKAGNWNIAASMGLLFSKVLDRYPSDLVQARLAHVDGLPFFIPDDTGLFWCHARRRWSGHDDGYIGLYRLRENFVPRVADPHLPWTSRVDVYINSYLAYKDLYKYPEIQAYLRADARADAVGRGFDEIFYSPGMMPALKAFWVDYMLPVGAVENSGYINMRKTFGGLFHREMEKQIGALEARIRKFLENRVWQEVFMTDPDRKAAKLDRRRLPVLPSMGDERVPLPIRGPLPMLPTGNVSVGRPAGFGFGQKA
ncbi:MAG TPA: hypothetical protein VFR09_01900 [Alphaproteobacteria bacterium]|nr:hypothetical protein [Alphaproteobacteria bacterium]